MAVESHSTWCSIEGRVIKVIYRICCHPEDIIHWHLRTPHTWGVEWNEHMDELECRTWYHHPRRLQCVKFSKSQRDIIKAVTISKITVFEIICNVAYYSSAKFTFPIEQPSNKATKCGIRGSWKLKVKPNLGCCSNIAITISYISVWFHLDNPKIDRVMAV